MQTSGEVPVDLEQEDLLVVPWSNEDEKESLLYFSSSRYVNNYVQVFAAGKVVNKRVLVHGNALGNVGELAREYGAARVVVEDRREVIRVRQILYGQTDVELRCYDDPDDQSEYDVAIFEWVGVNVLCEARIGDIPSVLSRLSPSGVVFPHSARCILVGVGGLDYIPSKRRFFSDVYGFDMSPLIENVVSTAFFDEIDEENVVTSPALLYELSVSDVVDRNEILVPYRVQLERKIPLEGLCTFLEIDFGGRKVQTKPGCKTRWRQCCFFFRNACKTAKVGDFFEGEFALRRRASKWSVEITCSCGRRNYRQSQTYTF